MNIHGQIVKGSVLDHETRCSHYHTEVDRIAIKFYCCQAYFPCYLCHEEAGCAEAKTWPRDQFDELAILCGSCGTELSIATYLEGENECPCCQAEFNPNCRLHEHLYFGMK